MRDSRSQFLLWWHVRSILQMVIWFRWGLPPQKERLSPHAHSIRAYDTQFIQEYCHRHGIVLDVTLNGTKILSLSIMEVKVIDSLSFHAMPLSSFPFFFALQELKNGFFPHLFNTSNNQKYKGPLPAKKYDDPNGMSESKCMEFETWYTQHQNNQFDFAEEILANCQSHVKILIDGWMAFRTLFQTITIIASACSTVFRTRFLNPNTIGPIPTQGYRSKDHHLFNALKWLEWVSRENGVKIQHTWNGGEPRIELEDINKFQSNLGRIGYTCMYVLFSGQWFQLQSNWRRTQSSGH